MRLQDQERFCQMLVDLNRLLRPRLYVMDGIVAMEGNGPRGGDPRAMSVLLLSDDPVALDATACRMIDLDVSLVPTNTWGEAWGLGQAHQVEILGDPLAAFVAPDFRANRQPTNMPGDQWSREITLTDAGRQSGALTLYRIGVLWSGGDISLKCSSPFT